jgi:lipooligosaccharide transport system permease protein
MRLRLRCRLAGSRASHVAPPASAVGRVLAVVDWHARGYRRVWRGSVTTSFLNPVFFLLSIGVLLGTLVDRRNPDLGGLSYLEFVAPALLATVAMHTASSTTTYPVIAGLKWLRTYHAVVATPVRVTELVAGVLAWAGARVLLAVSVFALVAGVGGAFASPLAVAAPLAGLLCGVAFAAAILAFSATLEDDKWLPPLFRFGLVPLFLFSGTFFPVDRLPDWLEPAAWATPLWHGVSLSRELAAGDVALLPAGMHVLYLVALTAVGAALAVRAYRRKLLR